MKNIREKKLTINGMSKYAIDELPAILDKKGLAGKYEITDNPWNPEQKILTGLTKKYSDPACEEADREGNKKCFGLDARTVRIRRVTYEDILVPVEEIEKELESEESRNSYEAAEALAAEKIISGESDTRLMIVRKGTGPVMYAAAGNEKYFDPVLHTHTHDVADDYIVDIRSEV